MIRRRDLILLPCAAWWPAPAPPALTLLIEDADGLAALARRWNELRLGPHHRVIARAHLDWWPSAHEIPDSWQAWIELRRGGHVHVVCRPRPARTKERPAASGAGASVAAGVRRALTAVMPLAV